MVAPVAESLGIEPDYSPATAARPAPPPDHRVRRVLELMEQGSPVRTEKLATEVGLSVSRLQHLFKHQTGRTLKQYRKELVLSKAAELLAGTFLAIKVIAFECGYRTPVNFTQDFTRQFGKSPRQYRLAEFTKK